MSAMGTLRIPRRAGAATIVLTVFIVAGCTTGASEIGPPLGTPSPSPIVDSAQTPVSPPPETALASSEDASPEGSEGGLEVLSKAAALWLRDPPLDPGERLALGEGRIRGEGTWRVFLFARPEGIGVGFRIAGGRETLACCLTRLRSRARPLAYIPIWDGGGVLLAHIGPGVGRVDYDCIQCADVIGYVTHIVNGRSTGVPQMALVVVRANSDGGNDGYLLAFDDHHRIDRDWIGLPPACTGPPCPKGLAWGSLEVGSDRFFRR